MAGKSKKPHVQPPESGTQPQQPEQPSIPEVRGVEPLAVPTEATEGHQEGTQGQPEAAAGEARQGAPPGQPEGQEEAKEEFEIEVKEGQAEGSGEAKFKEFVGKVAPYVALREQYPNLSVAEMECLANMDCNQYGQLDQVLKDEAAAAGNPRTSSPARWSRRYHAGTA
jgi:hypothetical protein